MRKLKRLTTPRKRRKGFTLLECIVSIAIFAIMGTMFASFMVSSVRVVNLSLANDRDREALLEAISAANSSECETANGIVQVSAVGTDGKILKLNINLYTDPVTLEDKYVKYTAPNKTVYNIYLGANAMSVKYLVIMNEADNARLLDAVRNKKDTDPPLQVAYKNEVDMFDFVLHGSKADVIMEIINDDAGQPFYIKYTTGKGEKYLIYLYKNTVTTP